MVWVSVQECPPEIRSVGRVGGYGDDLDFGRLYFIEEGLELGALRVRSSAPLPATPEALTRAEAAAGTPIDFEHDEGRRAKDLIGTTWATLFLVSDRFVDALGGFTGWQTYPVLIAGRDGEKVPGYQGLSATGRCGRIEWEKSERVVIPPPVPEGRARGGWRGLYFSPSSWDGSDVFIPDGTTYVIVTDEVRAAVEDAQLTNVRFTRLPEFERIWNRTPAGEMTFGP
jgi:hypothetical protein